MDRNKRSLLDITLEEAVEVLKLSDGIQEDVEYKLGEGESTFGRKSAQLYYTEKDKDHVLIHFSDDEDAISLWGNRRYSTHYKIIKYLEDCGFDLESASSRDVQRIK